MASDYRVSFFGNLKDFSIGEVLFSLACRKETGCLYVYQGQVIKKVYFREGHLRYIQSSLARESILRFLFFEKNIGKTDPFAFLQEVGSLTIPLLDWLTQEEIISPHEVNSLASELLGRRILDLFLWDDGEYLFIFEEEPDGRGSHWEMDIPLPLLIYKGIKTHYRLDRLKDAIEEYQDRIPRLNTEPTEIVRTLQLKADDAKFIRLINGSTALLEVAFRSDLDMERSLGLLWCLIVTGYLEFPGKTFDSDAKLEDLNEEQTRFAQEILANVPELLEKNPFQMLQVRRELDITDEDVRRGYYTLAQRYHRSGLMEKMPPEIQDLSQKLFNRASNFFEAIIRWVKAKEAGRFEHFTGLAEKVVVDLLDVYKVEAIFIAGLVKLEHGDKNGALKDFEVAMTMRPAEGEYRTQASVTRFKLFPGDDNSFKNALSSLRRSLDFDRYHSATYMALAYCYEKVGELEHANRSLVKALDLDPDSAESREGYYRNLFINAKASDSGKMDAEERKKRLDDLGAFVKEKEGKTHYEILGIKRNAEVAEVKQAYFSLAKIFHPDTLADLKGHPIAVRAFVTINESYDTLSSDGKRRAYDRTLRAHEILQKQEVQEKILRRQRKLSRAKNLVNSSDFAQSLKLLKEFLETNPDDKEALTYQAWAQFNLDVKNDPEARNFAENKLRDLSKKHPDYDQLFFFLGRIAMSFGDYSKADAYYRTAQGLNPGSVDINREIRLLEQRMINREPPETPRAQKKQEASEKKGLFGLFGRKK
jgi:curved DNA-binding protein CbpA